MGPTSHEIECIPLLVRPVQPQSLDLGGKYRIFFDPIEEVEGSVPVFLVFAEMKVDGGENASLGDIPVEGREEQPRFEVIPRDEGRDSVPYLQGNAVKCWLFSVVGL